jgi:hypothetical protein
MAMGGPWGAMGMIQVDPRQPLTPLARTAIQEASAKMRRKPFFFLHVFLFFSKALQVFWFVGGFFISLFLGLRVLFCISTPGCCVFLGSLFCGQWLRFLDTFPSSSFFFICQSHGC